MNDFEHDLDRLSRYVFENVPIHRIEEQVRALKKEFGKNTELDLSTIDFDALRENLLSIRNQLGDSNASDKSADALGKSERHLDDETFPLIQTGLAQFADVDALRETTMTFIEARAEKELTRAYDQLLKQLERVCKGGRSDIFHYLCLFLPDKEQFAAQSTPVLMALIRWIGRVIAGIHGGIRSKSSGIWKVLEDPDQYYLQLRGRIHDWERENAPAAWMEILLFLPDLFRLYVRLLFDENVAASVKGRLILALVYLLMPFDLLPEVVMGPAGYIDDSFLLVTVLTSLLNENVIPRGRIEQHWAGSSETLDKVIDGATFLNSQSHFFRQIADWVNKF